ncbi:hypothetical protein PFICI_03125 [Pestalotiopsis fici W106-1]|uniref:Riboflavin kinase n=1 Tax=Pestalotiopsis fici (strain W106-1 / CGMCC3.15140) TaxID=1229662 RepID=W3XGD9_PESFW|nr:uncharacterized protein PFICI_03125 [Pestalotiopsis fici W106-1]ETS85100.1 hypothetical protein PFICI_03125 [Pestalotiopsis fici W106-1]
MSSNYPMENIKRKPLPQAQAQAQSEEADSSAKDALDDLLDDYYDDNDESESRNNSVGTATELTLVSRPTMPSRPNTLPVVPGVSSSSDTITKTEITIPDEPSTSKSFWKAAIDETVYFAGGLISRPAETTKHYSILRHSSAIVYYKGPSTRVTVTIFSDVALPQDRSLWLQRKGFSGNLGMNVSTLLGTSANWIDVTPTYEAMSTDVPESDERAYQRDIKRFLKKGSRHVARETCVIRVPAAASDGYLRLVLCTGESRKKVLCPSPVFRIASTSTDVSIFRGASLSSMPIEAGLKVASVVGTTVANRYIGPARAVVDNRVQKYTNKYKPGFIAERAEHIAFAKSGLQDRFNSLEQNFDSARDVSYKPFHDALILDAPPEVIGADSGPDKPFPIKLTGTVVAGSGQSRAQLGLPTANLKGVSSDLLLRLNGVYFGWARIEPVKGMDNISQDWHEAIITVAISPYASPNIAAGNVATVHMIHDFGEADFVGAKLKSVVMAYLRPASLPDGSRQLNLSADTAALDIDIALASLSRESWGSQVTMERMKSEKSAQSLADKYVVARTQVQKRVDSIPLHLAGVRSNSATMIDKAYGRGGIYIRR